MIFPKIEKPTEHGAYFVRERDQREHPPKLVEVEPSAQGGLVWEFGKSASRMLALFKGAEWWGPVVFAEASP